MLSRLVAGLLAILLVVSVAVGVYAKRRTDEAQHQAQLAVYEQQLQRDPAASLHAALRAWNERHNPAAEAAVRTAFDADTPGTVLRGHSGAVVGSVLSPDGRTVLTSGLDGTATLFDSGNGRQIRSFRSPAQPGPRALTGALISPEGTFVSTTAVDGQVQLYETASGRHLGRLGNYSAQAFARWGTLDRRPVLLTWGWDGTPPALWDAATRKAIASYGTASSWTYGAALSPDARQVVTVESDAVFSVWDARSGRSLARSESAGYDADMPVFVAGSDRVAFLGRQSSNGYYYATFWDWRKGAGKFQTTSSWSRQAGVMAVSRTGSMVAVALDKGVTMLEAKTGKMIGKTTEEPDWVNAVAFSDDERWLVTGGNDGRTRVWLVGQWANRPVADLLGHRGGVRSASFQPGDQWRLVTASDDGTARVWQLPTRTIMSGSYDWILDASYSPDGRHIVTVEESEIIRIYDAQGNLERTWDGYSVGRPMSSARFTPDGDKVVLVSGQSYAPWVWNWRADTDPVQLTTSDRLLIRVAVSPDGKTAAAGDEINRVIVWDLASGQIVRRLTGGAENHYVSQTAYVPGSALIAAASTDGTVRLWGAADTPVRVIGAPGSPALRSMAVANDGRVLVTVSADHELRLWRLSDGKLLTKIDGPNSTISGVALNADASMVAAGAADGAVHVWAADDGHKITVLRRHGDAVNTVEFTPDGRGFLTASDDITAAIFPCTTCGAFETVRRNAQDRDDSRQRP
jgi:WD40 repeat protein